MSSDSYNQALNLLKTHDMWYYWADDNRTYFNGENEKKAILKLLKSATLEERLKFLSSLPKPVLALWEPHVKLTEEQQSG